MAAEAGSASSARRRDRIGSSATVAATGFRVGAAGNSPTIDRPMPGVGIRFHGTARGLLHESSSVGNHGAGLAGASDYFVRRVGFVEFDNGGPSGFGGGFGGF